MVNLYRERILQITEDMDKNKIKKKPSRFDMAINFYLTVKRTGRFYLVVFYNKQWGLYYPFYDNKNKKAVIEPSKSDYYHELIREADEVLNIKLEEKLELAKELFGKVFGVNCEVIKSKLLPISYELKLSKTTNHYAIYKFYNYLITKTEDINKIIKNDTVAIKMVDLDMPSEKELVGNAYEFCKLAREELKLNAVKLDY